MNRSKTLFLLTPGFPKDEYDSTCLPFPQAFVKNLKILYPELHIVILAFQYPFCKSRYQWQGAEVFAFNGQNKGGVRRLMIWRSVWKQIRFIVRQHQVLGILNLWLGECALIGEWAGKKLRLKSFTWLQGQDAKKNNRFAKLANIHPKRLIALSDFIADEFTVNYGKRPKHTIPPGIDIAAFSSVNKKRSIDILGAGSLIPLKRFDLFIEIVARLVKKYPQLNAVICGGGPERNKLQTLIDDLNMKHHIQLTGELPYPAVLEHMQSARFFLHTSAYEGFGMVNAEALYAGCRVLSFTKPMHADFDHWSQFSSSADMEKQLENMMNDPHVYHNAELTYPIEETVRQIMQLYI